MAIELTAKDYAMVKYFWEEMDDITAWLSWYKKRHLFKEKHPELVQAVESLLEAERALSDVVTAVCSENT